ncbi:MAG: hypothetical protein ABIA66_01205 [Candidatus Omnitrophota bacterium]
MAKAKKKEVKPVKKEVKPVEKVIAPPPPVYTSKELKDIAEKRDDLIAGVQAGLLTVSQLKRGGSGIRARHMTETGYSNVLAEINELGKKLSLKPIGLGNLRKP